jgi:hypothetical protein
MVDRSFELEQDSPAYFDDRDRAVLQIIGDEGLLGFTFEGLRRRLGTHSETLSRILSRLEKDSILARTAEGYVVTERGMEAAVSLRTGTGTPGTTILRTVLPTVSDSHLVVSSLMGKWFGNLRWFGYSGTVGTTVLKWVTEDGRAQVDATFTGYDLTIRGRAARSSDMPSAIAASHRLVGYISRLYTQQHGRVDNYMPADSTTREN